ncbi:MAG: permease [Pseudomonadota bacterium]
MTALVQSVQSFWQQTLRRPDLAWLAVALIYAALAALQPAVVMPTATFTLGALAQTAPFILFAVAVIGYLEATGAQSVVARAFQGRETSMIFAAALVGGLAPFCSCEVIPFIAALLVAGAPLSAIMALWLSSPLMDPAAFVITASALGFEFAVAKTVAAVSVGLLGGFAVKAMMHAGAFQGNMLLNPPTSCCGAKSTPKGDKPVWRFWQHEERRAAFWSAGLKNAVFLLKWLTLAYTLEALMIRYIPAETIAGFVGGDGVGTIMLSALLGAPAYLNGYAAPALVSGLMDKGMDPGAAMAFMIAGGATSIPAMTAVFALVKRQVFAAYLALAFTGAVLSGLVFALVAGA